eukprot:scaffold71127_cov20-Tisochrysis_lutea.AAC.2
MLKQHTAKLAPDCVTTHCRTSWVLSMPLPISNAAAFPSVRRQDPLLLRMEWKLLAVSQRTLQDILGLVTPFGHLKSCRLPKKYDGNHRGYAFVEFVTKQEARNALEGFLKGDNENDGPAAPEGIGQLGSLKPPFSVVERQQETEAEQCVRDAGLSKLRAAAPLRVQGDVAVCILWNAHSTALGFWGKRGLVATVGICGMYNRVWNDDVLFCRLIAGAQLLKHGANEAGACPSIV